MQTATCALPGAFDERVPSRALYSPKETGIILDASHATVYRLISKGRLDARKLGAKTVITRESIERLISELPPADVRLTPRLSAEGASHAPPVPRAGERQRSAPGRRG